MHFTHWNVVAVHTHGLFFPAEGRLLVILLQESCTNIVFYFNIVWQPFYKSNKILEASAVS